MDEAELMDDGDHLVELASYSTLADLKLAQSLLGSAEIECFPADDDMARSANDPAGVYGVRLFVWSSDLHAARSILLAEWPKPPGNADLH